MEYWGQIIQGKTDSDTLNIGVNLAKGALGGLAVHLLSKTSCPTATITATAATAALVGAVDQEIGGIQTFQRGISPIYRGIQLYTAYYALSRGSFAWAAAAVAEPAIFSCLWVWRADEGDGIKAVLETWGVRTYERK